MKKKPGTEGRCSRTRAIVKSGLSQVTVRCSVQPVEIMAKDRALTVHRRKTDSTGYYRLHLRAFTASCCNVIAFHRSQLATVKIVSAPDSSPQSMSLQRHRHLKVGSYSRTSTSPIWDGVLS